MPRRAKSFIYINRHVIKANQKAEAREPPITVECRGERRYGHSVRIDGPSELVYRPDSPRSCGARVWIETYADVIIGDDAAGTKKTRERHGPGSCGL